VNSRASASSLCGGVSAFAAASALFFSQSRKHFLISAISRRSDQRSASQVGPAAARVAGSRIATTSASVLP
jgi:hypothetical protein